MEAVDLGEREASQVDRLFEAIANYTYDWESWMGDDGRPRWINPAVERMTGYTVAECHAMSDYPLPLVHEDDRADMAAHLRNAAAGLSGNDITFRIRHRAGEIRWAAASWQSVLDEDGRSLGYRTSIRDITRRKQAENALQEAHAEADRANRAKSRFLAAASHDLRQPLQAISMFVSALKSTASGPANEEIIAALEDSLRATNGLLDSLLEMSRLDAGVLEPKPRDFAIGDLLDRMEHEFAGPAAEKGIGLRVVASSAFVHSDPTLLDRMLRNLVSNAVRYTSKGRILIGCRRRGSTLRVEICDTGIGIPADKLDAIFEEFLQLGNPERDRTRGLGLGLAIVHRLAKLLGHRIDVRSEPGRGSRFAVEMPVAHASAPVGRSTETAADSLAGALLVAIDDEAMQLRAMSEVFRRWGCVVIAAVSAAEAIDKLSSDGRVPAAVIADYRLRDGATGVEAISAIGSSVGRPVPGIILTGDIEPVRLQEVVATGLVLLHKPIDAESLRQVLQRLVGQDAD
ncbi:ATP-binding protein [Rhodospirillaceae bacterium SYSU D60014]|uniref:PAS domain-containing hybrid sensor histidine kinase/response regulator n=1 Tax=Virgifigura deserti TaxID=2268457 RepID=UPI000E66DEDF